MSSRKIGAGFIALLFKIGTKFLSALPGLVKGAKVGKVGLAATSVAAYSYLFTWQFAVLILVSIFVHESGHVWAMKRCGIKTKGIYFIPFLGAAAVADEAFPSRSSETYIAIMGPIWGLALAVLTGLVYLVTGYPFFAAAASWMALINLFNLLPVNPLDGGRIFKSISFSIHSYFGLAFLVVGLLAAIFITFKLGIVIFAILFLVGAIDFLAEYRSRLNIPNMGSGQVVLSFFSYVIVVGCLWGLMYYMSHVPDAELAMKMLMS